VRWARNLSQLIYRRLDELPFTPVAAIWRGQVAQFRLRTSTSPISSNCRPKFAGWKARFDRVHVRFPCQPRGKLEAREIFRRSANTIPGRTSPGHRRISNSQGPIKEAPPASCCISSIHQTPPPTCNSPWNRSPFALVFLLGKLFIDFSRPPYTPQHTPPTPRASARRDTSPPDLDTPRRQFAAAIPRPAAVWGPLALGDGAAQRASPRPCHEYHTINACRMRS